MSGGISGACALASAPHKNMLNKAEKANKRESRFIMTSKPQRSQKGVQL
jgi:hypothetical protein